MAQQDEVLSKRIERARDAIQKFPATAASSTEQLTNSANLSLISKQS